MFFENQLKYLFLFFIFIIFVINFGYSITLTCDKYTYKFNDDYNFICLADNQISFCNSEKEIINVKYTSISNGNVYFGSETNPKEFMFDYSQYQNIYRNCGWTTNKLKQNGLIDYADSCNDYTYIWNDTYNYKCGNVTTKQLIFCDKTNFEIRKYENPKLINGKYLFYWGNVSTNESIEQYEKDSKLCNWNTTTQTTQQQTSQQSSPTTVESTEIPLCENGITLTEIGCYFNVNDDTLNNKYELSSTSNTNFYFKLNNTKILKTGTINIPLGFNWETFSFGNDIKIEYAMQAIGFNLDDSSNKKIINYIDNTKLFEITWEKEKDPKIGKLYIVPNKDLFIINSTESNNNSTDNTTSTNDPSTSDESSDNTDSQSNTGSKEEQKTQEKTNINTDNFWKEFFNKFYEKITKEKIELIAEYIDTDASNYLAEVQDDIGNNANAIILDTELAAVKGSTLQFRDASNYLIGKQLATPRDAKNVLSDKIIIDYIYFKDSRTIGQYGNNRKYFGFAMLHDGAPWTGCNRKYEINSYDNEKCAARSVLNLWKSKGEISTHYYIGCNGTIFQFVPETNVAWHGSGPNSVVDINPISIGIDFRNCKYNTGNPYTSQQIESAKKLLNDLKTRGIIKELSNKTVIAHFEINKMKNDPLPGFNWASLGLQDVRTIVKNSNYAKKSPFLVALYTTKTTVNDNIA